MQKKSGKIGKQGQIITWVTTVAKTLGRFCEARSNLVNPVRFSDYERKAHFEREVIVIDVIISQCS